MLVGCGVSPLSMIELAHPLAAGPPDGTILDDLNAGGAGVNAEIKDNLNVGGAGADADVLDQ